jgi:hypothetical protein
VSEQLRKPLRETEPPHKEAATDLERKAEERQTAEELEEEEERRAEIAQAVSQYSSVQHCMDQILEEEKLEVDDNLPAPIKDALELLFQARTGTNERGTFKSALACKRDLNRALAILQPILSVALLPEQQQSLEKSYKQVQDEVGALKYSLTQRILKEAGAGKKRRKKKLRTEDTDAAERSELGDLAWELAQLVRKRKREPVALDPVDHPIAAALDELGEIERGLGKLALSLGRVDARKQLAGGDDPELDDELANLTELLAEAVRDLAARCAETDDPTRPGAYPVLRDAFAELTEQAGALSDPKQIVGAARLAVDTIDGLLSDPDAVASAAAGGGDRRGLLGRLFGRRKK